MRVGPDIQCKRHVVEILRGVWRWCNYNWPLAFAPRLHQRHQLSSPLQKPHRLPFCPFKPTQTIPKFAKFHSQRAKNPKKKKIHKLIEEENPKSISCSLSLWCLISVWIPGKWRRRENRTPRDSTRSIGPCTPPSAARPILSPNSTPRPWTTSAFPSKPASVTAWFDSFVSSPLCFRLFDPMFVFFFFWGFCLFQVLMIV